MPVILAALQPRRSLDYSKVYTFMQLENDNICSVPEFTGVAIRLGKRVYYVIIGTLYDDEKVKKEIAEWCAIANVLYSLKGARLGLMGHTMEAMDDSFEWAYFVGCANKPPWDTRKYDPRV